MTTKTQSNNWQISWQFLGALLAIGFGGIGFLATSALLKLPNNPNCTKLSLLFTSATNRIYCAHLQAEQKTVTGLLNAISLVRALGDHHPLKNEIDRNITIWTSEILEIATEKFNQGELKEAIAIVEKIPQDIVNYDEIQDKIEKWRLLWASATEIEEQVEAELREAQWNKAFLVAVKLLNVDNEYWQTTKYQEIIKTINLAKEESKKLDGAYVAIKLGGIDNLFKTIEIASAIPPSSYSYNQAQKLIEEAELKLNELASKLIDSEDWNELANLAARIPDNSDLKNPARDWLLLASAGRNANLGTVSGMELAIAEAEEITSDSDLYETSIKLISRWELEKEDLAHLATARELARPGNVGDLRAAIAKAELITSQNPLYRESQREIQQWNRQIQIIEDQPILNQAQQIAAANNPQAWQQAINQARRIGSERALYSEALSLINTWRQNIEREEDQPILDQAIVLGNRNNYQNAIDMASRIARGRVLYGEAQNKMREWRREIIAEQDLERAYQIAQGNDLQSLVRAISIVKRIPASTNIAGQTRLAINRWSEQLLAMAKKTADDYSKDSLKEAINIAETVPSGSSAYSQAQQQIKFWSSELKPPLVIPSASPITPSDTNINIPIQETNYLN
jgi:hypothetical protein